MKLPERIQNPMQKDMENEMETLAGVSGHYIKRHGNMTTNIENPMGKSLNIDGHRG